MAERKTDRNERTVTAREGFRISKKPVVQVAAGGRFHDVKDSPDLRHVYDPPALFAIARDPQTIFVSWNINWHSVFEKGTPPDRQVHLQVYRADGLEEIVAVEAMAAMHYVTISDPHCSYRVGIGYYQPADVWHSVAMSNEILMPRYKSDETGDIDTVMIPFHVSFQQLLNLFGPATDTELAAVISQFEKRALSSEEKTLSGGHKKILRKLHGSVSELAAEWRAFNDIDGKKLARRTRALLGFGSSSLFRGFGESSWS
jgi:hypothetical protein